MLIYKYFTVWSDVFQQSRLKFCIMVAGQLDPLGDGGLGVAKHSDKKFRIAGTQILETL